MKTLAYRSLFSHLYSHRLRLLFLLGGLLVLVLAFLSSSHYQNSDASVVDADSAIVLVRRKSGLNLEKLSGVPGANDPKLWLAQWKPGVNSVSVEELAVVHRDSQGQEERGADYNLPLGLDDMNPKWLEPVGADELAHILGCGASGYRELTDGNFDRVFVRFQDLDCDGHKDVLLTEQYEKGQTGACTKSAYSVKQGRTQLLWAYQLRQDFYFVSLWGADSVNFQKDGTARILAINPGTPATDNPPSLHRIIFDHRLHRYVQGPITFFDEPTLVYLSVISLVSPLQNPIYAFVGAFAVLIAAFLGYILLGIVISLASSVFHCKQRSD